MHLKMGWNGNSLVTSPPIHYMNLNSLLHLIDPILPLFATYHFTPICWITSPILGIIISCVYGKIMDSWSNLFPFGYKHYKLSSVCFISIFWIEMTMGWLELFKWLEYHYLRFWSFEFEIWRENIYYFLWWLQF